MRSGLNERERERERPKERERTWIKCDTEKE